MTPSSLLALVGLVSAGLAHAAPAPRPLISTPGIDLGATAAGVAFCETSQRAVLALSTGDLVAIDSSGALHRLGSLGRPLGPVQLACDRNDQIFAPVSGALAVFGNGTSSSHAVTFRYVLNTRVLDDGKVALVDNDGVVWRWDGTQLASSWQAKLPKPLPPGRVALRGDGKALAILAHDSSTIHHEDGRQDPAPRAFSAVWSGNDLVHVHRGGLGRWTPGTPITSSTLLDAKLTGYQLDLAGRRVVVTAMTTAEIRELDASGAVIGSATATRLPGGYKMFALGTAGFGVVAVGRRAHVLDLTRSSVVIDEQHPLESPRVLAFSPDGASLAMTGNDNDVMVATLRTSVVHRLVASDKRVHNLHLAWASDGIYVTGEGGYLHWDRKGAVTSGRASFPIGFTRAGEAIEAPRDRGVIVHRRSGPVTFAMDPTLGSDSIHRIDLDNDHAVVKRGRHIELYRLDAKASRMIQIATTESLRFPNVIGLAGKSPRAFYVDDRKLHVLDANGDKELATLASFSNGLAVSKDRRRVAISHGASGISIFDADSGKSVATLTVDGMVTAMAWSPDGKRLAVASPAGVTLHSIR